MTEEQYIWDSSLTSLENIKASITSSSEETSIIRVTGLNKEYEVITREIEVGLEPVVLEEFLPYPTQAEYKDKSPTKGVICVREEIHR